jgi:Potato inhibitor I family
MVGGSESKREGPWPECLGWTGSKCQRYVESYGDEKLRGHVHIVPAGSMVTMDFDTDRVRIYVDEADLVNKIPRRG